MRESRPGPAPAKTQQTGKTYRVGLIFSTSPVSEMTGPEPVHPLAKAFLQRLRTLGYILLSPITAWAPRCRMAGGSLADLNYGRCADSSVRLLMTAPHEHHPDPVIFDRRRNRRTSDAPGRSPPGSASCGNSIATRT
jgi:hypothetical protein